MSFPTTLRASSNEVGAVRKPSAEVTPAPGGTMKPGILSDRAIASAWAGPAPPKAIRKTRRTSAPRSATWIRVAAIMLSFTTS